MLFFFRMLKAYIRNELFHQIPQFLSPLRLTKEDEGLSFNLFYCHAT